MPKIDLEERFYEDSAKRLGMSKEEFEEKYNGGLEAREKLMLRLDDIRHIEFLQDIKRIEDFENKPTPRGNLHQMKTTGAFA